MMLTEMGFMTMQAIALMILTQGRRIQMGMRFVGLSELSPL
jgi:hypothetical protein